MDEPDQGERLNRLADGIDSPERTAESRRRERRADVATYRVRVTVTGTKPPLWRRLELASDMHLDALHDVIQIAFGWTDSHLHRFSAGNGDREALRTWRRAADHAERQYGEHLRAGSTSGRPARLSLVKAAEERWTA